MRSNCQFILADMRGKHETRPVKVPEYVTFSVREHIESFPKIESHYCRKDYLERIFRRRIKH